jgi:hypothetical protein
MNIKGLLLTENERNRILFLHNKAIKKEFLFEETQDEITKYFEKMKTSYKGFPNGQVVDYKSKNFNFGYKVTNADGTYYILIPDGTAISNNGTGDVSAANEDGSQYKWTDKPYEAVKTDGGGVDNSKMAGPGYAGFNADANGNSIPDYLEVSTSGGVSGNTTTQTQDGKGAPTNMLTPQELKKLDRELIKKSRQQKRAELKQSRENQQKCLAYIKDYDKVFGDETRKTRLLSNEQGKASYLNYRSLIDSCCANFNLMTDRKNEIEPILKKGAFCSFQNLLAV